MRLSLLTFLLPAAFLSACGNAPSQSTAASPKAAATTPRPAPKSDLSEDQTRSLMSVLDDYYALKDALVATSNSNADKAASRLLASAELFNDKIAGAPHAADLSPLLLTVKNGCDSIVSQTTGSTEDRRRNFSRVSDAMYAMLHAVNLKNGGVYQQYCPMAFNSKGAYWLSNESEIKNPYFGRKMLECGDVRDSF